ncbi:MAG: dTDP-4-dehydrorhamnose 3,5-epimerase [bacterium]|nr:dTDP-4-dehydrorhamnose 3,5-epimerase [bacterium]
MKASKTKLEGVMQFEPQVFEDFRGRYVEIFNKELYAGLGVAVDFVQDDISVSMKNVLRGIHGDENTWKLISCLQGTFYLVVVNCDTDSKNFGKWEGFTLSDRNRKQILVPPRHGNAHLVMSDTAIFHYKQSTYYSGAEKQFTYRWDNPKFAIWWPIENPVLSQRDELGKFLPT